MSRLSHPTFSSFLRLDFVERNMKTIFPNAGIYVKTDFTKTATRNKPNKFSSTQIKRGMGMKIQVLISMLIIVLSAALFPVNAAAATDDKIEVKMLPLSTSVENSIVTMTTRLKLVNNMDVDISSVQISAASNDDVQVSPRFVTAEYLAAKSEIILDSTVTIVSPRPDEQQNDTDHGISWTVNYSAVDAEEAGTVANATASDGTGVLLSEILFCHANTETDFEWVELYNSSNTKAVDVTGYEICNSAGVVYRVIRGLEVPAGAFVLVQFDGVDETENDLSFDNDNLAVLHVVKENLFDDEGDICAVFKNSSRTEDSICGYVSWGNIGKLSKEEGSTAKKAAIKSFSASAIKHKLWSKNISPIYSHDQTNERPKGPIQTVDTGGSIGIVFESTDLSSESWVTYCQGSTTPGKSNPLPAVVLFLPEDQITTCSGLFTFSWIPMKWALCYQFQICIDSECMTAVVDRSDLTSPYCRPESSFEGAKKYYWRVRGIAADGTFGAWSPIRIFTVSGNSKKARDNTTMDAVEMEADKTSKVLGVTALAARKDTALLCLDGCERESTNTHQWDGSHESLAHYWDHESSYCYATAIAMINHYYGGNLTRDEIAWRIKATDNKPEDDLSHSEGAVDTETTNGLVWALDPSPTGPYDESSLNYSQTRPTNANLKAWIDANRPVMFSTPIHWMVVDGYRDNSGTFEGHFLNVDNDGNPDWRPFATHSFDSYYVPDFDSSVRNTDSRVSTDSDGDGIMDFDEEERFATSKTLFDSDSDYVGDKSDIASYVFRSISSDIDGDGLRGEVDDDSDDGGVIDGEEDLDQDGKYEPAEGETDPHNKADDAQTLDLIFCIDTTGSMYDDIASVKTAAVEIVDEIATEIPDFRIAVVDYRDFPYNPYGGSGDYAYNDVLGFSSDQSTIVSAINSLSLGYGNDWEESVYSGIMHCIESTSLGGWRGQPIKKAIIVMGDAPPHDPEPYTGYTMADVIQAAEDADPVIVFPVVIGGNSTVLSYFTGIADGTGGEVFTASSARDVVNAIMSAINVITYSPFAEANGPYTGYLDEPILFTATGSYDPDGVVVLYEWDWDNDGTYDESTTENTCSHTWTEPYEERVRLRVTDDSGLSSIDTADVTVIEYSNQAPAANAGNDQVIQRENSKGAEVTLDGSGSTDPDEDALTYEWVWDSGTESGVNPVIILRPGVTTVSLTVSDGDLTDTDSVVVSIVDADLNNDGQINIKDLIIMTSQWLGEPKDPSADLAPAIVDNFVNTCDFAVMAANWEYDSEAFITVWDTNLEEGTTVTLALCGDVEATVDWGDGILEEVSGNGPFVHDYGVDGVYTVAVKGSVEAYNSLCYGGDMSERRKLISVNSWGRVGFTCMEYAFANAINLRSVPSTSKGIASVTNMYGMFYNANVFNSDISQWDTSNVTDMSYMFYGTYLFNQDIGEWNTSNVESMNNMFYNAMVFNADISNWDTSNVVDMYRMFFYAASFDQNIGQWDTSNVVDMCCMFYYAQSFNQDISDWDTGNVLDMSYMFRNAYLFNQNLDQWCVWNFEHQPIGFDTNADSWVLSRPVWGTCP